MKNRFIVSGAAALALIAVGAVSFGATGCSKKDAEKAAKSALKEEAEIKVSGTLSLTGEQTMSLTSDVALTDLSVYCVTFAFPPQAGTGTVDASGNFSVTINAAQVSIGCFILKGEEQLGSLVFKDPSKTGLSGESTTEQRQAFSGDAKLGAIALDLSTGKAEVDVSKIEVKKLKKTDKAEKKAFDFSGTYAITSAGITLPSGYTGVCPPRVEGQHNDCNGPSEGESIWVRRIKGKMVADGKPVFGISVWDKKATFDACGGVLGMTAAEAAEAGIDLSGSDIPLGEFTWTAGFTDGWKNDSAVAKWDMGKMEQGTVTVNGVVYNTNKQYFTKYQTYTCNESGCTPVPVLEGGYTVHVNSNETGCRDSAGKPAKVEIGAGEDWGRFFERSEPVPWGEGLNKNVEIGRAGTKAAGITCTHIGGAFKTNGTPLTNGWPQWPGDFESYAKAGDLCSSIPDTAEAALPKLRCYADGFWKIAEDSRDSATPLCLREIQTNWSATTAADFIEDNGPKRAIGQHIFERFQYDSPDSGSFRQESVHYNGIQDGNMWTDCKVQEVFTMSFRKIDKTDDLIAEMISDSRNLSPKPACIAAAASGKMGVMKAIFKMVKTGE